MERFIKAQKSRVFLTKLIEPDFVPDGKFAQLVRVPKLREVGKQKSKTHVLLLRCIKSSKENACARNRAGFILAWPR